MKLKDMMAKKVDKAQAIELKTVHNLSYAKIAKIQGVHPSAVHQAIKDILPKESTQRYVAQRSDIFARAQEKLLLALDDAKIKSMTGLQLVTAMAILYDKEKLEKGISAEKPPVLIVVKGDNTTVQIGAPKIGGPKKADTEVIDV